MDDRDPLAGGGEPKLPVTIVLGCADRRVPPEILFDEQRGALFVVRVAGNVVTPPQLGSIEIAADRFGARRIVVLGHTRCAAVAAALEDLRGSDDERSPAVTAILDCVKPAIAPLLEGPGADRDTDERIHDAERANAAEAVRVMTDSSETLRKLADDSGLERVAAIFDVDTGAVKFLPAN